MDLRSLGVILLTLACLPGSLAWGDDNTPVVVELYTSQGCSSCPGADKFLGELASQENVIALSCHVTYWNYLGWRDTLSLEFCDQRQAWYRHHFNNPSSYTPQMVINGKHDAVGSQRGKVHSLLKKVKSEAPLQLIELEIEGQQLTIRLSPQAQADDLFFTLLGTGEVHEEVIKRGENEGRTISYTHPVLEVKTLKKQSFNAGRANIDLQTQPGIHSWVVLANDKNTGKIVAAGRIKV